MVYAYIPVGGAPNALKVDVHVHVEFYVAREQSTVIHVRTYLAVYMNLLRTHHHPYLEYSWPQASLAVAAAK